ncbi:RNA-binding protein [Gemella haemolysans]|uniref:YlmH family RNA-binding protein n=1 Tax=Gemella haemolysans TaxID=1379 RepID=UPI00261DD298|nr:YlmH/Sll1252 family protein [Gemella haemolysans]MDU3831517.1 YlmH/Sll1252 family protein [Gemella haemolysans]
MKKLNFLQQASAEQREAAEKLLQSISFVENRNTVTKFLTNFEQVVLSQIVAYNYSDFKVEFFGGFDDAERKKAKIISNEYYDVDYDIVCLKAKFNNKFNKVEHRNILGAVHNLGINFNRFGDIIVLENEVYIFVDDEIADYIAMEFTKAGRVNLDFQRVDLTEVKIEKKYEDFEIVSSSFRIDSIVAKITNKSRSKVKEFLEQDFIKLNHVILRNGEKTCTPDDIISIRKYGRYVVKGYTQNKKSLKYRITISKLV